MFPYILLMMIIMLWVCLEEKSIKKRSVMTVVTFLVIFSAARDYTVGSDTPAYTAVFRYALDPNSLKYDLRVELGFQFLVHQVLYFTKSYYVYFMIVTTLATLPVIVTLKKISTNFTLSVFIFLSYGFYFNIFNPERQSIAMAICFFALPYLIEKKIGKYFLLVLLASLFHISAWLMMVMYFVCHAKMRESYKAISCLTVSYLGSSLLLSYLAQNNDRYVQYTEQSSEGAQGRLTLYFYVFFAAVIFIYGKLNKDAGEIFMKCRTLLVCGVCILIPIAMLSTDPSGPQRIIGYFAYGLMIMLPIMLGKFKNVIVKYIFVICSLIYYFLIIYKLGGIYPYKINPIFDVI